MDGITVCENGECAATRSTSFNSYAVVVGAVLRYRFVKRTVRRPIVRVSIAKIV